MTPKDRLKHAVGQRTKDRMAPTLWGGPPYVARMYDGMRDALVPIDIYQYPKLYVKAMLAYLARFAVGCCPPPCDQLW